MTTFSTLTLTSGFNLKSPTALLILFLGSTAATMFQYDYRYNAPSYLFPAQKYIAVPGRIIQHQYLPTSINEMSVDPTSYPFSFQKSPIVQTYYELEHESSSSSPPPEDDDEDLVEPGEPNPDPTSPPPSPENEPPASPSPPPPHHMEKPTHSGIIHKHISVYEPPKDFEFDDGRITVIRPTPSKPKKHLNIIFIKAPTISQNGKTEIILPETPLQKTLIYVLVKRPNPSEGIRVIGPSPTEPPKPQVHFIRYKQNQKDEGYTK